MRKAITTMSKAIGLFVLLHLLAIGTLAQNVPVYGCLAGRSATVNLTEKRIFVRTGLPDLDAVIIDDLTELDAKFGVNVPVYFLNDELANAFFTPTKFPARILEDGGDPNMSVTGSVFFSIPLLMKEFRDTNGSLMSVPAILAHEFAHAMQFNNRFPYQGKWRELHADYMAGWFIAHRGRFRSQNAWQAMISFYQKGDTNFFDADHHGTPEERAAAFYSGFLLNIMRNESSGFNAYNAGLQYLMALGAR
jgi:hypothetical protein